MAGIGVKLNRIFEKKSLSTKLYGIVYSTIVTAAPMFLIIGNILLMGYVLGLSKVSYSARELFSCTVLYVFIFAMLVASPLNSVLSRYISDLIYDEKYTDILPCYYIGMMLNVAMAFVIGVPFCIHEYIVGEVPLYYVYTSFCCYMSLVLVFYSMLYLSICKDYKKIAYYYFLGMLVAFILAFILNKLFKVELTYSMLVGLTVGFFTTAALEFAKVKSYFRINSNNYRGVFKYFYDYWELIFTNFFYTLGLYIHNFVFWTTSMRMVVVKSFVCAQPYDMATCLAMFTNISATVIFISRIEMHFHERYKSYSEAILGGRGSDIRIAKRRMFGQVNDEIMNLVRVQFIISVVLFLACIILLPQFGFSGLTMRIYPCMAAGYFILFLMYAHILFLCYFNDLKGSLIVSFIFLVATFGFSVIATFLSDIWYGIGVVLGSFIGYAVSYFRLRWVEKHLDTHIFCRGSLLRAGTGKKPPHKVYDVYELMRKQKYDAAGLEVKEESTAN